MNKIAVIVTTFNRMNLLKENIEALLTQSYTDFDLIIVNNASTDGTEEYVKSLNDSRIKYFNTGANIGGAGGFAYGMEKALSKGYDYAWLMDDDSIPNSNALEILVDKADKLDNRFSFLATTVYWTDMTQFPMNTTIPENGFQLHIDEVRKMGLIRINTCSFVGCFVNLEYAEQVGLPIAEYFIYGDDIEYTTRLRKKEQAYWAIDSEIIHKAPTKIGSDIVKITADRLDRFSIQTRNGMHYCKLHGGIKEQLKLLCHRAKNIIRKSPDHKIKRLLAIAKGMIQSITFNPQIVYVKRPTSNKNEGK